MAPFDEIRRHVADFKIVNRGDVLDSVGTFRGKPHQFAVALMDRGRRVATRKQALEMIARAWLASLKS